MFVGNVIEKLALLCVNRVGHRHDICCTVNLRLQSVYWSYHFKHICRTKIVIDNKIIEQVNSFNYLGSISYEKELDIDNKLRNYLQTTGILNNVFRPQKNLKKTRIKLYNTLTLPVLLCGSKTWTVKTRDARRITAAEMKYIRRKTG